MYTSFVASGVVPFVTRHGRGSGYIKLCKLDGFKLKNHQNQYKKCKN
jgi:hypothetical protein